MILRSPEWHCLSFYLTPVEMKRLLDESSASSRSDFERVRSTATLNMFLHMPDLLMHNPGSLRFVFEQLVRMGYFPDYDHSQFTNSKFGFLENQQWVEWDIPSIAHARAFWDAMLKPLKQESAVSIQNVLRVVVSCLPGLKMECQTCRWLIPENSMHSQITCIHCYALEKKTHAGAQYQPRRSNRRTRKAQNNRFVLVSSKTYGKHDEKGRKSRILCR